MIRKLLAAAILSAALFAQTGPNGKTLTGTACVALPVENQSTVVFQVTGTWSGTIQPQVAVAGQSAANLQVTPTTSTTAQSTVTGNGAFIARVSGFSLFQVCGATVTGTASIYANVSKYAH